MYQDNQFYLLRRVSRQGTLRLVARDNQSALGLCKKLIGFILLGSVLLNAESPLGDAAET